MAMPRQNQFVAVFYSEERFNSEYLMCEITGYFESTQNIPGDL